MIAYLLAYGLKLTGPHSNFKEDLPDGLVKALDQLTVNGKLMEQANEPLLAALRARVDIASLSEFPLVTQPTLRGGHDMVLGFPLDEELLDSVIAVDGYKSRWDLLVAGFPEPLRAQILVSAGVDRPRVHVLTWDDGNIGNVRVACGWSC